jgi:D-lactate dehydrogenase
MCFVEVEEEARDCFQQAFQEQEVSFVERLEAVPEDIEVLSVFISERVDGRLLDVHPSLRLIATRSTGCDHIDLNACTSRGVMVASGFTSFVSASALACT